MPDISSDYQGAPLPLSSAPQHWIGSQRDAHTTGTNGPDAMYGTGEAETLSGGPGDDTYFVYSPHEVVVEAPDQGVDTIVAGWTDVSLPANVENLFISGTYTGVGNDAANVLVGDAAAQTLDGGRGDDVLTGGGGADIFAFGAASGRDVLTDFVPGSGAVLRLSGYPQITSFAQVSAQSAQVGADVVITLDSHDSITLRSVALQSLSAADFQLGVDLSHAKLSFDDEFNGLGLQAGGGPWRTDFGYGGSPDALASRTLTNNQELEIYVDPAFKGQGSAALGLNPFTLDSGVLTITAAAAPAADRSALYDYAYTSGLLTTQGSFSQEYGYFEVRAELPAASGAWPGFWLLPTSGAWPPELDILETFGGDTVFSTAHSGSANIQERTTTLVTGATTGFHTYGMLWDASHVTWYVDGVETGSIDTPPDMHQPMYLLLNLAVANGADTAALPADFKVDYVRAYTLDDPAAVAVSQTSATIQQQEPLTLPSAPADSSLSVAAPLVGHPDPVACL